MPQKPRRYEITDFEWSVIQRLWTGSARAHIPERYGPYTTCCNRDVRWRKAGVRDRPFAALSRAYDGNALRKTMAGRGLWANIKPMPTRANLPSFSLWLYRYRNLVERFFSKPKHFRAIATRFEKHDANDPGLVKRAAATLWMRIMSR